MQRIAELLSVDPSTLEVTSVEGGTALEGGAHSEEEGHGGAPPTPPLPAGKGERTAAPPMSWCCTPVHSLAGGGHLLGIAGAVLSAGVALIAWWWVQSGEPA